jgi:hypothetical protein
MPVKKQSLYTPTIRKKITSGVYGSKSSNDMYNRKNNPFQQKYGAYHRLKSAYNKVLSPYNKKPYRMKIGKRYKLV